MYQERTVETKLMKYYRRNIQKEFISDEKLYIFIKNSNALKYNPYIIQLIICHVNLKKIILHLKTQIYMRKESNPWIYINGNFNRK